MTQSSVHLPRNSILCLEHYCQIACLELNSYPIQDICSTHISHHTILHCLGHLYFHALIVSSFMLLCNCALNCVL